MFYPGDIVKIRDYLRGADTQAVLIVSVELHPGQPEGMCKVTYVPLDNPESEILRTTYIHYEVYSCSILYEMDSYAC